MIVAEGSMRPREVWAMRLDEAVSLCAARAAMTQQAKQDSGKGYEERADGTRAYPIHSMADLYGFFGSKA